jgi:hypothetical protein
MLYNPAFEQSSPRREIMKLFLLLAAAILLLAACADQESNIHFTNKTECGTATIKLTNTDTGDETRYTLDEGQDLDVDVKPSVAYNYDITYEGYPSDTPGMRLACDAKKGTITIPQRGQDANINLTSVTPTPDPG